VNLGALCALRVLGASRASLGARLIVAPLVVGATVVGGTTFGARGAAWGWATASALAVYVWYRQLLRHERDRSQRDATSVIDPAWSAP